ncbi:MAG: BLUF domain-containing protein, partial [Kangiellaceae bacterium]|nr:BLUF domain-containing protein [Kangiellaceae bacterium]
MTNSTAELTTITYVSHSLIKSSELEQQLKEIEGVASANNAKVEISGILLFRRNRFIQRLEGPKAAIDSLIEVIKQDKRHRKFTTLYYGQIPQRYFTDWSKMEIAYQRKKLDELDQLLVN